MMGRVFPAFMLAALTGCAATGAIGPTRELYDHGWDSVRRAEGDADDRAATEAHADILRAFAKLKGDLRENSAAASRRGKDMAETLRGRQMPEFSPQELGDVIGRLIDAAEAADPHVLQDFRRSIADRGSPDGFDPVRRAILDRELRRRGIIPHRTGQ